MMIKNSSNAREDFIQRIEKENPYRSGALVAPRLGYFYPTQMAPLELQRCAAGHKASDEHPYGIIIGPSLDNSDYSGREYYRVKFGATIYEKVHPVQMEIINEV